MLGTPRLLTFAFRALVLVPLISILWLGVAEGYNEALVSAAQPLFPGEVSARAVGTHIIVQEADLTSLVSVNGFTLHFGLILMAALVLAAVGIGVLPRLGWLLVLGAGTFPIHVVGVALLAHGVVWASGASSPDESERLVFSMFAVFWGLIPAVIGGVWCLKYWLPRASRKAVEAGGSEELALHA